ncbi:hypothetical protein [Phenylobacterium sp.]|uniref:hypothetical protein n=1 Tax=Phenylobacterium sp. TaxID=1871053 RepID=UPI002DE333F3|nr:hypothetical protein [Phenylobacterium sp.]
MSDPTDPFADIAAALPTFEDDAEAMMSLREQAMRDPLMGAPMDVAGPGEPEEMIEPGGWHTAGYLDRRTGLPSNCPVKSLGQGSDGESFYFLNTLGSVHVLAPNAGKGHIDALFAGRGLYLSWAWPRWSAPKKGLSYVTNWEAEQARQALFAACAYKGTFELEDRVRGRGAWRDDDGSLIYHAGDAVWIAGRWRPPGEYGRFIYPGRPRIGRPGERYEVAGEGSPGDLLFQALQSWNWDRGELDARLALGWLMTGLVGGALEQRPVAYIVGTEGAGKSTLQKLLRLVMNGALVSTSNTTQAGIYQKVRQDSIAVMVDELEAKEDTRTTDKILELARIAYSGDKMQRGGKDGVGQEFAVMSSFLFSSIALPAMDAQDASRMAVLMMRERVKPAKGEKPVDVLKDLGLRDGAKAQAVGRHLLRRMFKWMERWDALRDVMRETLLAAGHEDRAADTFGALMAGCHVALSDDMPGKADLAQWTAWLSADQLAETATREKTWRRCFTHMLQAQPDVYRSYAKKSVAAYIEAWRDKGHVDDVLVRLPEVGLSVSWPKGAPEGDFLSARLFVPAKHPALHTLFAGTPWAGRMAAPGPWAGVLRQMPRELWENGKCDKGLDRKASGIFINLAEALEA